MEIKNTIESINKEAIYHVAHGKYAYQDINTNGLKIILRVKKNNIQSVSVRFGDPFDWKNKNNNVNVTQFGGGDDMIWNESEKQLMIKFLTDDLFDYYLTIIHLPSKRIRYTFEIEGLNQDIILYGENGFFDQRYSHIDKIGFTWGYLNQDNVNKIPKWVLKTVWYQIFPERFANGDLENDPENTLVWNSKDPAVDSYFGGDLQGVINHLDHIQNLGCNGIYFTPIFKANTNHKYDTEDYLKIDNFFGDEEKFQELIEEAHRRNIKIMIDAVFNHCGSQFEPWLDVIKNKKKSIYYDWFFINNNQNLQEAEKYNLNDFKKEYPYETFAFTPFMPRLNWNNKEAKNYIKQVVKKWTSFKVDAWRLDVANEPTLNFWRDFRYWVKNINPENYILGEVWYDANLYLNGDIFDGVMNYKLRDLIINLIQEKWDKQTFINQFSKFLLLYNDACKKGMFNLLSSHDTPRLLTVLDNDLDKFFFAYKFMFMMLGSPCIYYGDEIGITGEHDPLCRKCMIWDEKKWNMKIYHFFQKLIQLRKDYPIFSYGDYQFINTNNDNLLMFKIFYKKNEIFAFINFKEDDINIDFNKMKFLNIENNIVLNDKHLLTKYNILFVKKYE